MPADAVFDFPDPSKTHRAAQAEYGRLAAQAYTPSDAMSQAAICLGGPAKGSTSPVKNPMLKRSDRCRRICLTVGWSSRLFPAVGDPDRMAPCGGVVLLWRCARRGA